MLFFIALLYFLGYGLKGLTAAYFSGLLCFGEANLLSFINMRSFIITCFIKKKKIIIFFK
jgi:hypothetical protein